MLTNRARYIVIGAFVILAVLAGIYHIYEITAAAVIVALFILWGYFKSGAIVLALRAYQQKDYVKTALLLANTANPDRLARKSRGNYEFMKANLALRRKDYPAAETHFQIATRFPMPDTQKVSIFANLATIALMQTEPGRTDAYLELARNLKPTAKFRAILDSIQIERNKLKTETSEGLGSAF